VKCQKHYAYSKAVVKHTLGTTIVRNYLHAYSKLQGMKFALQWLWWANKWSSCIYIKLRSLLHIKHFCFVHSLLHSSWQFKTMPSNCQSYDLILRINNTSMTRHISAVSKRKQRNSLPSNTIFTLIYHSILLKHIQVVQKLLPTGECWLATVLMSVRTGLNSCFLSESLPIYLLE
jgi:hypothetical protein